MPFGSTSWRRLLGCWWLPKSFFGCAAALASTVPNSIMLMTNAVFSARSARARSRSTPRKPPNMRQPQRHHENRLVVDVPQTRSKGPVVIHVRNLRGCGSQVCCGGECYVHGLYIQERNIFKKNSLIMWRAGES